MTSRRSMWRDIRLISTGGGHDPPRPEEINFSHRRTIRTPAAPSVSEGSCTWSRPARVSCSRPYSKSRMAIPSTMCAALPEYPSFCLSGRWCRHPSLPMQNLKPHGGQLWPEAAMADRLNMSLEQIARALGGEVSGGQVLAPGPNHSPEDRSLRSNPAKRASSFSAMPMTTFGSARIMCGRSLAFRLGTEKPKPTAPLATIVAQYDYPTRTANCCSKSCASSQRNSPTPTQWQWRLELETR